VFTANGVEGAEPAPLPAADAPLEPGAGPGVGAEGSLSTPASVRTRRADALPVIVGDPSTPAPDVVKSDEAPAMSKRSGLVGTRSSASSKAICPLQRDEIFRGAIGIDAVFCAGGVESPDGTPTAFELVTALGTYAATWLTEPSQVAVTPGSPPAASLAHRASAVSGAILADPSGARSWAAGSCCSAAVTDSLGVAAGSAAGGGASATGEGGASGAGGGSAGVGTGSSGAAWTCSAARAVASGCASVGAATAPTTVADARSGVFAPRA